MTTTTTSVPTSIIERIDSFCELREATDPVLSRTSSVYTQIVELNNEFLSGSQRKDGLSEKHKVLTLLAIHTAHGTEQSIDFAMTAALQVGATQDEIMDCIDLALLTTGGTAVARAQFAIAVMEYRLSGAAKAVPAGAVGVSRLAAGGGTSFKEQFAFVQRLPRRNP